MPVKTVPGSKNAAVERREARALRHWARDASPGVPACRVMARQGAGASRTERLPALYPLVCEGTKKEASPVRFAVTTDRPGRRSVGCLTSEEAKWRGLASCPGCG